MGLPDFLIDISFGDELNNNDYDLQSGSSQNAICIVTLYLPSATEMTYEVIYFGFQQVSILINESTSKPTINQLNGKVNVPNKNKLETSCFLLLLKCTKARGQ